MCVQLCICEGDFSLSTKLDSTVACLLEMATSGYLFIPYVTETMQGRKSVHLPSDIKIMKPLAGDECIVGGTMEFGQYINNNVCICIGGIYRS